MVGIFLLNKMSFFSISKTRLILDLWGISFHAVVVFGLGKDVLFESVLEHCVHTSIFRLPVLETL